MCEHRLPACSRSLPSLGVGPWRKRPSREPVTQSGWCHLGSSHTFHSLFSPFLRRILRQLPPSGALEAGQGDMSSGLFPCQAEGGREHLTREESLPKSSLQCWTAARMGTGQGEPRQDSVAPRAGQSLTPPYQSNSHSFLFQHLSISCLFMLDALR